MDWAVFPLVVVGRKVLWDQQFEMPLVHVTYREPAVQRRRRAVGRVWEWEQRAGFIYECETVDTTKIYPHTVVNIHGWVEMGEWLPAGLQPMDSRL